MTGDNMHALSIKQPYAWQILTGDKPYEYRTWLPGTVQQFLLVSSSQPSAMDFGWGLANGYALAVVDIIGTPQLEDDGSYAWPVKVHAAVTPFPVKGKLHFYEVADAQIHQHPEWAADLRQYQRGASVSENSAFYRDYLAPLAAVGFSQMPLKYQKIYNTTRSWEQVGAVWAQAKRQ